jgi:hypothetical protein
MRDHEEITRRGAIIGQRRFRAALAYRTFTLGLLAAGLAFPAPVFAAAPETPETKEATAITGTTATLHGVLNPAKGGEAGEYDFTYKRSATECAPEGRIAPEPPAAALGAEKEAVAVELTGLEPSKQYTFCVVAAHTGESSMGAPVTFKTLALKPAVEGESSSSPTQTEVTLETQINPNNQATTCIFEYGASPALGTSVPCEPATLEGNTGQHASATLAGLSPNTVYYYRVTAENGAGKAEGVPVEELRTAPPPPVPVTGDASFVTPISATIMGTVNPSSTGPNSEAFYFFEYSTFETPPRITECSPPCVAVPTPFPGGPVGQGTSAIPVSIQLPAAGQPPLAQHTIYHYRIVAYNGPPNILQAQLAYGEDATFDTPPFAPGTKTDPPVVVGRDAATLAGEVVAQQAPTSYVFKYGTTTAYGATAPSPAGDAGSSATGQYVTAAVEGLQPGTTYHYVLVATNSGGTTQGQDATFITNAAGEPSSSPLPSGFSLTGTASAASAPAIFPDLTGLRPTLPASSGTKGSTSALLTRAQRLSKALKACKKDKSRAKRVRCEKAARRKNAARAR